MARVHYQVHMVNQGHSQLCWLACAAMLLEFKNNYSMPNDEIPDHLQYNLGTIPSVGLDEFPIMRQMGFINARSSELRLSNTTPSQTMIFDFLKQHGPFILHHHCGSFWYGPNVGTAVGGHAVLIVGTDTTRGCVWFNNPWGNRNVMTTTSSIVGAINRWEGNPSNTTFTYK